LDVVDRGIFLVIASHLIKVGQVLNTIESGKRIADILGLGGRENFAVSGGCRDAVFGRRREAIMIRDVLIAIASILMVNPKKFFMGKNYWLLDFFLKSPISIS
jgi:hypothetical protein